MNIHKYYVLKKSDNALRQKYKYNGLDAGGSRL
jgi:hypothetical protein